MALTPSLLSASPLSEGLPKTISTSIIENDGYDDFNADPNEGRLVGDVVMLDGHRAPLDEEEQVFSDDRGILLPPGGAILRIRPGGPKEVWDFPIGTRFVHRFYLRTSPRRLYELHMSEKRADGRWAYGIYIPDANGKASLSHTPNSLALDVDVSGRLWRISVKGVGPQSCRECHLMESGNHYPDEDRAGPCGFGPANKALLTLWAPLFKAKHGYAPFLN